MFSKTKLQFLLSTLILANCGAVGETVINRFDGGQDISDFIGPSSGNNIRIVAAPTGAYGQHMTLANGCSYSRAQAPGYAPTWHLILNPHHISQPNAHRGCAAMLTS